MGELFYLNSMVRHGGKIALLILVMVVAIGIGVTVAFDLPYYLVAGFAAAGAAVAYFVMVISDLIKVIKDMLLPQ